MSTLLLRNARLLITMDDTGQTIPDGALFVRDKIIEWLGPTRDLSPAHLFADRIIDASDMVVLPGLIDTHHHLYQTLSCALAPDSALFDWPCLRGQWMCSILATGIWKLGVWGLKLEVTHAFSLSGYGPVHRSA